MGPMLHDIRLKSLSSGKQSSLFGAFVSYEENEVSLKHFWALLFKPVLGGYQGS